MIVLTPAAMAGVRLSSVSAFVYDIDSKKIIIDKNSDAIRPIASLTKLYLAKCVVDNSPNLLDEITITKEDIPTIKKSESTLPIGIVLNKVELLYLTLSSSNNMAAYALARSMNNKAISCMNTLVEGSNKTKLVEPSGLDPRNVSTAKEIAWFVSSLQDNIPIQIASINNELVRNTNRLIRLNKGHQIFLSKTGYISESGYNFAGIINAKNKQYAVVLLGARSGSTRIKDLSRVLDLLSAH